MKNTKRLLSLLLSVVMVLSLIPTFVFAEEITWDVVTTAAELTNALASGGYVRLGADITAFSGGTLTTNLTLDLNGKSLACVNTGLTQGKGVFWIKDGGHLTIQGAGAVSFDNAGGSSSETSICYVNGGNLTIKGGTYSATSGKTVKTESTTSTTTIEGGTFNNTVDHRYGNFIMNDGTVTGEIFIGSASTWKKVTINGGTINKINAYQSKDGESRDALVINGGLISTISKGANLKMAIAINGGAFKIDPSTVGTLASGLTTVTANSWYAVVEQVDAATVLVDNGEELKVALESGKSVMIGENISYNVGKATITAPVTLDLNGKTITCTSAGAQQGQGVFYLASGAHLTVQGAGNINFNNAGGTSAETAVFFLYQGDLTVKNGTFTASTGKIIKVMNEASTATIDGGTFKAYVDVRGGTLVMNGGAITSTVFLGGADFWKNVTVNGGTVTTFNAHTSKGDANDKVLIKGGMFTNFNKQANFKTDIVLQGGTFKSVPTPVGTLADGCYVRQDAAEGDNVVYTVANKIAFFGTNVALQNNLDMNFFVTKTDLPTDTTNIKAVITRTYADGRANDVVTVPFAQWNGTDYVDYYYITYANLAAKEMTDSVTVQIIDGDKQISENYTDTIAAYAKRMFGSTDLEDKWKPVYAAMLKYGAAAQTTWGYGTGAMADAGMTDDMIAAIPNVSANYEKSGSETYIGMTMELANTIETWMVFSGISEGMTAEVSFTKYNATQPTTFTVTFDDMVSYGGSWYGVSINSLVFADVDSEITVTIMNGETVVAFATDSIAGYVTRMSNGNDVYSAIYALGNAAHSAFTTN